MDLPMAMLLGRKTSVGRRHLRFKFPAIAPTFSARVQFPQEQNPVKTSLRPLAGLALAWLLVNAGAAVAQSYPNHPIKLLVPWPPGQATDVAARMVAERLTPAL